MTDQAQHNQDLIAANRERLRVLELQAATFGNETPPHILTEINKITATIRALTIYDDLRPDEPTGSQALAERRRDQNTNQEATLRMIATVQATVAEVSNVKSTLRQNTSDIHQQITDIRTSLGTQINTVRTEVNETVKTAIADTREIVDTQLGAIDDKISSVQTAVSSELADIKMTVNAFVRNVLIGLGIAVLVIGFLVIAVTIILKW